MNAAEIFGTITGNSRKPIFRQNSVPKLKINARKRYSVDFYYGQ